MAERFILDPAAVASNRTELDITPWVNMDGLDWGDASVQSYYSEAQRGDVPVDYRVPNREITGGLMFAETHGGTTAITARAKIQAKLSLFQREGGWLARVTNSGGTVYADVVDAQFRATSVPGWASRADVDTGASFSLSCIPDFYGDEQTLSDHSETSAAELIFTENDIEGDFPGRVRIVVDEDDAEDQRGLIWAFRSRHYSDEATAQMEYEAEELGALDTATKVAGTAVYGTATSGMWSGGTIVHHGTLSTSWTPVLETDIGGTTALDHTGTYQVFARLASTSGTTVGARFVYDVGDLVNPVENAEWRFPGANNPYIADLGEIRLDAPPVGTHRWQGQVQMRGDAGAETGSVDKLWIVNKDEGMGRLSAPIRATEGLITYSARSEFTTESGAITGDSLQVGGSWTAITNSDTTDFSESSDICTRTATNDTGTAGGIIGSGRGLFASSTTSLADTVAQMDFTVSAAGASVGLLLRVDNAANDMLVVLLFPASVGVYRVAAGAVTTLSEKSTATWPVGATYTAKAIATSSGVVQVYFGQGLNPPLVATAFDSALATGGALATGAVGFWDENDGGTTITRTFANFAAWVPSADAVAYANQSAQLTTDGMLREDSGGNAYGPVSVVNGDLPRIPVAGLEDRTTEVFLKATRGDLDQLPDTAIDDLSSRISYRPSWLFVDDN